MGVPLFKKVKFSYYRFIRNCGKFPLDSEALTPGFLSFPKKLKLLIINLLNM